MSLSASLPLLLVLAWDDADLPGRPVGEAARSAALTLLRALAARQPLLAVLPHLPDGARATPGAELPEPPPTVWPDSNPSGGEPTPPFFENPAEIAAPKATPGPIAGVGTSVFETIETPELPASGPAPIVPGEMLLPALEAHDGTDVAPGYQSRLLGVAESLPAVLAPTTGILPTAAEATNSKDPSPAVSLRLSLSQQASQMPVREPAAPYQGHSETTSFPLMLPGTALPLPLEVGTANVPAGMTFPLSASPILAATPLATLPPAASEANDLAEELTGPSFDPDPELPLYANGDDSFAQNETGPAESAALAAASEPEFTPALALDEADEPIAAAPALPTTPARASLAQGLAALGPAPQGSTIPFALADDLHYRIIQFARFAGPLVEAQGQEFGIIYAADWPTWLAALELRYRLRCPLVLHLSALAIEQTASAGRGWLLEMERYAMRRSQLILVSTEALREQVLAHYPMAAQVAVVPTDDAEGIAKAMAGLAFNS